MFYSNRNIINRRCLFLIKKLRFFSTKFPIDKKEHKLVINKEILQPENAKINKIAILGAPNAGKSTLVNSLVGYNICGESSKINTTRESLIGVYNEKNVQIILTDTPGCINSQTLIKQKLEPTFLKDPDHSCIDTNIIAVLHDCSLKYETKLDASLIKILQKYKDKKSILIMTKIDLVKDVVKLFKLRQKLTGWFNDYEKFDYLKKHNVPFETKFQNLLEINNLETKEKNQNNLNDQSYWPYFSEAFYISSHKNLGIDKLKDHFLKTSISNPWVFNKNILTDVQPEIIIKNIIRSKVLDCVNGPSPYKLKINIIELEKENNQINILAKGLTDKRLFLTKLIGKSGKTVNRIDTLVSQSLTNLYKCNVCFHINFDIDKSVNQK